MYEDKVYSSDILPILTTSHDARRLAGQSKHR